MLIPIIILSVIALLYSNYEKNKRREFIAKNKSNPIKKEQKLLIEKISSIGASKITQERDNEIELTIDYSPTSFAEFKISRTRNNFILINLKWTKNEKVGFESWNYKKMEVDENIIKIIDYVKANL